MEPERFRPRRKHIPTRASLTQESPLLSTQGSPVSLTRRPQLASHSVPRQIITHGLPDRSERKSLEVYGIHSRTWNADKLRWNPEFIFLAFLFHLFQPFHH